MRHKRFWLIGLALLAMMGWVWIDQSIGQAFLVRGGAIAQSAPVRSTPVSPASPLTISPSESPIPTSPSTSTTTTTNTPTTAPSTSTPATLPEGTPPASLPAAAPLPLNGDYRDPAGRFKVGILKNYNVSPLAGSLLAEAPDGSLSYTVVLQPQSLASLAGSDQLLINDALAQVTQATFQRGEGFQPGIAQPVAQGVLINWTGNLTIAGKTQPVSGVILARSIGTDALLLLIAATQAGTEQVPSAIAALASTLEPLSVK